MHCAGKFPAKPSLPVWQSHHTLFNQSMIYFWFQWGYTAKWKMFHTQSQNMENNFQLVQCTLMNKVISLDLLYFLTCWASCNNGVNIILQKYGKGGGRGGKTSLWHLGFNLYARLFFFLFFFLSLFVCLLFLSRLREEL